jgi:hypothetical protein
MNYSSLTIFTLFILCFTTYLHVSAELTGYPYPISSIQKQIVLTGIWEIDVTKLTTTAPVSISFEYKPPQSTTKISPVNAILQIYQRELLLIDTPIKLGRDKNSLTFDVHFDQTAFSRLDPAHNIHYYLQYDLTDSPTQAGMVDNSNISSCLEIKQSTISPSAQQCFPHPITASALKPIDISNTQTNFRAYCNGQTPPAPMELTNNNINNNTTPCDIVDRFHINAYGLALTTTTTTKPTLTFQIAGHAIIRSKSGIFHPQQISCRVNTHYVTFYRADNIPAEFGDTTFFPSQKNIYVAYDVTELYNEGVLELECDQVGLYYPVKSPDHTVADRIAYNTVVQVTIADENDFSKEKFGDDEQWKRFSYRNSFLVTFNSPDIINPVDLDLHATSNMVMKKNMMNSIDFGMGFDQIIEQLNGNFSSNQMQNLPQNEINTQIKISKSSHIDEFGNELYDLFFFGSFYLTGTPDVEDVIQICPSNIGMTRPLGAILTQQNFNATTRVTDPDSLIILFSRAVELQIKKSNPEHFIPGVLCYSIPIFEQNTWRPSYTKTPQVFHFSISTQVTDYQLNSALYSRYVSHLTIPEATTPTTTTTPTPKIDLTGPRKPKEKRYIYAATPLPSHQSPFADKVEISQLNYDPEEADQHSQFSSKLDNIIISGIKSDLDRVAFVLSGNHFFDGDIQCLFKYTSIDGDQIEDYLSALVDKTVQSARMVRFDLEEPLSAKDTPNLTLKCKGLFVVSRSWFNYNADSILMAFGRDHISKEFNLTTLSNIRVSNSNLAPEPHAPIQPDIDPENGDKWWKKTPFFIAVGLIVVVIIAVAVFFAVKRITRTKTTQYSESLILDSDVQYFE